MEICFAIIGIGFLLTIGAVGALNVLVFFRHIMKKPAYWLATKYMRIKKVT